MDLAAAPCASPFFVARAQVRRESWPPLHVLATPAPAITTLNACPPPPSLLAPPTPSTRPRLRPAQSPSTHQPCHEDALAQPLHCTLALGDQCLGTALWGRCLGTNAWGPTCLGIDVWGPRSGTALWGPALGDLSVYTAPWPTDKGSPVITVPRSLFNNHDQNLLVNIHVQCSCSMFTFTGI